MASSAQVGGAPPERRARTLSFGEVAVLFPADREPFPQQLAVMRRVVEACETGKNAAL